MKLTGHHVPSMLDPFRSVRTHSHLATATPITFCICSIHYVHSRQKTMNTNKKILSVVSVDFPKLDSATSSLKFWRWQVNKIAYRYRELKRNPLAAAKDLADWERKISRAKSRCIYSYSMARYENSIRLGDVASNLLRIRSSLKLRFLIMA